MSSNEDLQILVNLEPYFFVYSSTCYGLKVLLLIPVIYVISMHSPASMESYKLYLIINVITTAFWGLLLFIGAPMVTAPSLVLCSSGVLQQISPLHFRSLIGVMIFAYISHITSTMGCLLYQYVHLRMSPLRKYFYHYGKAAILYVVATILVASPISYSILGSTYNTEPTPQWILGDNPSLNFSLVQGFLLAHPSCFKLNLYENIVFLFISFLIIASVIGFIFSYIHYNILRLFSKTTDLSQRTEKMQWNLYKFILIQTFCILFFYMIPIIIVVAALAFKTSIASIILSFALAIITIYELTNLVLILTYIGPYRQVLIKALRCIAFKNNSVLNMNHTSMVISTVSQNK